MEFHYRLSSIECRLIMAISVVSIFVFHLDTESICSHSEVFERNLLLAINFQTINTGFVLVKIYYTRLILSFAKGASGSTNFKLAKNIPCWPKNWLMAFFKV